MSELKPLLTIQGLDLESDKLAQDRANLPERAALRECQAKAAQLDEAHRALLARREELSESERTLSAEVAGVAAKAKEVEDNLYSGSVTAPKELEALQEEIRLHRERQGEIEEREMEILEEIEATEGEAASNREDRAQTDEESRALETQIAKAEQAIDAELAELATTRATHTPGIPNEVLAEYERLRGKASMGGRAAAPLEDGVCGGCRVKLPVLEYNKMKAKPPEALITCVHCYRVFVR